MRMLTLEDYIAKRKKEDKLNEYDIDAKLDNMRICVNYVFEYFNQYLDATRMDEQTVLNVERLEKYKNQLHKYDPEIQEWLVSIYDHHDRQINRSIISFLKKDELFFLYSTDQEFRTVSYDCYAQLIKKNTFLKNQTEMLFQFIKDHHRVVSQPMQEILSVNIAEEVNEWIEKTWNKHQVNLMAFGSDYVSRFFDEEDKWDVKHTIKSNYSWRKYDYDYKQKNNLFNINLLYRRLNKSFIRGKKQYLEILLMYCWLHEIESDENYWHEYLSKTLLSRN